MYILIFPKHFMISASSCEARSRIIPLPFYRWGHFTSRCEMEDLEEETMYSKSQPYKISSLCATTAHPVLPADINNPSPHSFPLSSNGVSESLPHRLKLIRVGTWKETHLLFWAAQLVSVELASYSTLPLGAGIICQDKLSSRWFF